MSLIILNDCFQLVLTWSKPCLRLVLVQRVLNWFWPSFEMVLIYFWPYFELIWLAPSYIT